MPRHCLGILEAFPGRTNDGTNLSVVGMPLPRFGTALTTLLPQAPLLMFAALPAGSLPNVPAAMPLSTPMVWAVNLGAVIANCD